VRPRDEVATDEAAHVPQGMPSAHGSGHEEDRPSRRLILIGALVFAAIGALGLLLPTLAQLGFQARQRAENPPPNPLRASAGRELPPSPRLQVNPTRDLAEYRAEQEEILASYGWVDRNAGIVRIPIERAMDLVAERAGAAPAPSGGAR